MEEPRIRRSACSALVTLRGETVYLDYRIPGTTLVTKLGGPQVVVMLEPKNGEGILEIANAYLDDYLEEQCEEKE